MKKREKQKQNENSEAEERNEFIIVRTNSNWRILKKKRELKVKFLPENSIFKPANAAENRKPKKNAMAFRIDFPCSTFTLESLRKAPLIIQFISVYFSFARTQHNTQNSHALTNIDKINFSLRISSSLNDGL